jgi:uncharacterized membrane protein
VTESWSLSGDLTSHWLILAGLLAVLSLLLLVVELRRDGQGRGGALLVALSGVVALAALLAAVLRPVRVQERGATVGARVLLLVDGSRSIDLPSDDGGSSRRDVITEALAGLDARFAGMRTRTLVFGSGEPVAYEPTSEAGQDDEFAARPQLSSDLSAALEAIATGTDERPQALVVVSDGRLDRPGEQRTEVHLRHAIGDLKVPIHTVKLASNDPEDAAIVSLRMAGAVVAHQPVALTVEIACTGGLSCDELAVTARELHHEAPPVERASGTARVSNGRATVDLEVVLDRAGKRILEVAIESPEGDTIGDNDRRFVTVDVARDRVRLLHIAGRPTYDVRALRTWLKADASVDVVAFFILRTHRSAVGASPDELALIPFPVDELFTVHLPSFDAVVLQDFDARPYGLSKHLSKLARYVEQGGGLIMVGGPNAFVSGNYARTPLASVLPVALDRIGTQGAIDLARFTPQVTRAGKHAPVLEPLTGLLGSTLPTMPGVNVVGDAREGATVLWEHPSLTTRSGGAMPVLALGEYGSGRSIALTVDGSHKLAFSTFAASAAGRGHGAFWDGLLGWLMRDPRFEPVKARLPRGCIAGVETMLELRAPFVEDGTEAEVVISRMGSGDEVRTISATLEGGRGSVSVALGKLGAGGHTATVRLRRQGRSAPSRYDFACEVGGDEWADPRPDPARLSAIAKATGGEAVGLAGIGGLPRPQAARVVAERRVRPVMPAWGWTLTAAVCLGGHWVARRRSGLS